MAHRDLAHRRAGQIPGRMSLVAMSTRKVGQYYARKVGQFYRVVTPVDALKLAEDIKDLTRINQLLDWIEPTNVAQTSAEGRKQIRWARATVASCLRFAQDKLRHDFLTEDRLLQTKIERTHKSKV
jgi:hypothetical protein